MERECPFCGSSNIQIRKELGSNADYYASCENCMASSAPSKNRISAGLEWDTRSGDVQIKQLEDANKNLNNVIRNISRCIFGFSEAGIREIDKEIKQMVETRKKFRAQNHVLHLVDQIKHLANTVDQIESGDDVGEENE